MPYTLFDYVDTAGRNAIKTWTERLQTTDRAKLDERLDKLQKHGDELVPRMLTGTSVAGIQKLRIQGRVQLRPMLCKGPISVTTEYTLLAGATEVGSRLKPNGVEQTALTRKREVIGAPLIRRKSHERVV
jgi:hypothetical protein